LRRLHKDCGGLIVKRKCDKCGKTWSRVSYFSSNEIEDKKEPRFNPEEYRKRIRDRRDLP